MQSASAFQSSAVTAPGSWLEIFGTNLASTTRGWATSDFSGNNAPTSLDKVSVTVGGKNAYVAYVSPGQVNVLVPDGVPIGNGVPVVVTSGGVASDPVNVNTADIAPAILAPNSFDVGGKQYVVATFATADSSLAYVGPSGAISGVNIRPAKAGEVVTLYGIGFGPVSPGTASGTIAQPTSSITSNVSVQFGTTPATIQYAGLAPGFVGTLPVQRAGSEYAVGRLAAGHDGQRHTGGPELVHHDGTVDEEEGRLSGPLRQELLEKRDADLEAHDPRILPAIRLPVQAAQRAGLRVRKTDVVVTSQNRRIVEAGVLVRNR